MEMSTPADPPAPPTTIPDTPPASTSATNPVTPKARTDKTTRDSAADGPAVAAALSTPANPAATAASDELPPWLVTGSPDAFIAGHECDTPAVHWAARKAQKDLAESIQLYEQTPVDERATKIQRLRRSIVNINRMIKDHGPFFVAVSLPVPSNGKVVLAYGLIVSASEEVQQSKPVVIIELLHGQTLGPTKSIVKKMTRAVTDLTSGTYMSKGADKMWVIYKASLHGTMFQGRWLRRRFVDFFSKGVRIGEEPFQMPSFSGIFDAMDYWAAIQAAGDSNVTAEFEPARDAPKSATMYHPVPPGFVGYRVEEKGGEEKEVKRVCDFCKFEAGTSMEMTKHVWRHVTPKPHACPQCGHSCPSQGSLTVHIRNKHGVAQGHHQCTTCKKYYASARNLQIHMDRVHLSVNTETVRQQSADSPSSPTSSMSLSQTPSPGPAKVPDSAGSQ